MLDVGMSLSILSCLSAPCGMNQFEACSGNLTKMEDSARGVKISQTYMDHIRGAVLDSNHSPHVVYKV